MFTLSVSDRFSTNLSESAITPCHLNCKLASQYPAGYSFTTSNKPKKSGLTYLLPFPILMHSRQFDTMDISSSLLTLWSKHSFCSTTPLFFFTCKRITYIAVMFQFHQNKENPALSELLPSSRVLCCGNSKTKDLIRSVLTLTLAVRCQDENLLV